MSSMKDIEIIARNADELIRERYDSAFEIGTCDGGYYVAAPKDEDEAALSEDQPTAVYVGSWADFEDEDELEKAAELVGSRVYDLINA